MVRSFGPVMFALALILLISPFTRGALGTPNLCIPDNETSVLLSDIAHGRGSPFLLLTQNAASEKEACGSRCQQQANGCYDVCDRPTVPNRQECHDGCLNRYRECKIMCGYDL